MDSIIVNGGFSPMFRPADGKSAAAAICMSGVGSNAQVLLERAFGGQAGYRVAVIFTDAPETSAAAELGKRYQIPVAQLDIRRFYADNGEDDIRLTTARRRELRRQWSGEVWEILRPYHVDFAVFAGFVPLNQLPEKLPCLNVHPGDLTVESAGVRRYAGLHFKPVETAILDGNPALRSSVILVQTANDGGRKEVDAGPVLGISAPVPVDLDGHSLEELRRIAASRTAPPFRDVLREVAKRNLENLKVCGDHQVLPAVVAAFAAGKYGRTSEGGLAFRDTGGGWQAVRTVEFSSEGERPVAEVTRGKRVRNIFARYLKWLYIKVVRTQGSPDYVARGWALGMFVGCVVPVFFQLIVAVPLSFVIRGSKVGAALGTFITTPPTAVFIYPVLIWVGNRVIGGQLSYGWIKDKVPQMLTSWQEFFNVGRELVAAFFAGGLLWAAIMTPLTYFLVRFLVIRYRRLRESVRQKLHFSKSL